MIIVNYREIIILKDVVQSNQFKRIIVLSDIRLSGLQYTPKNFNLLLASHDYRQSDTTLQFLIFRTFLERN